MQKKIVKAFKENLVTTIVAIPGLFAGLIIADIIPLIDLSDSKLISNSILLKIVGLQFYLLVLCIAWLFDGRNKKLKIRFGTKWDKDLNPHCPTCETALSQYQITESSGPVWQCLNCNKGNYFYVCDDNGKQLDLIEAQKRLKDEA